MKLDECYQIGVCSLACPKHLNPREAINNLKIDKITVWDSGNTGQAGDGQTGTTGNFLRGLIGSLPPIHELAHQAGLDLPSYLGKVENVEPGQDEPQEKSEPSTTPPAEKC